MLPRNTVIMCIPLTHWCPDQVEDIFYQAEDLADIDVQEEEEDWSFDDHPSFTPTIAEVQAVAHHFDNI